MQTAHKDSERGSTSIFRWIDHPHHQCAAALQYIVVSTTVGLALRSYNDAFREFFDELANLNFIDALSRILALAVEQIRKSTQLMEAIFNRIIDTIMSSTIPHFNLGPRRTANG